VRDEVMTQLLAGHDTTASALTWTWYLLSQHPEVEAKLNEELETVLSGRAPTLADLPRLCYTEQVTLEAMRLYPPVWEMSRTAKEDCELGGYHISAGSTVFFSQWVMHRHPRYFDNPEVFYPDRWADNLRKRLPTYVYLPFGGGPHICIGQNVAQMEMVLVLATIVQRFRMMLQKDQKVELELSLTLRPKSGMKMICVSKNGKNTRLSGSVKSKPQQV